MAHARHSAGLWGKKQNTQDTGNAGPWGQKCTILFFFFFLSIFQYLPLEEGHYKPPGVIYYLVQIKAQNEVSLKVF